MAPPVHAGASDGTVGIAAVCSGSAGLGTAGSQSNRGSRCYEWRMPRPKRVCHAEAAKAGSKSRPSQRSLTIPDDIDAYFRGVAGPGAASAGAARPAEVVPSTAAPDAIATSTASTPAAAGEDAHRQTEPAGALMAAWPGLAPHSVGAGLVAASLSSRGGRAGDSSGDSARLSPRVSEAACQALATPKRRRPQLVCPGPAPAAGAVVSGDARAGDEGELVAAAAADRRTPSPTTCRRGRRAGAVGLAATLAEDADKRLWLWSS